MSKDIFFLFYLHQRNIKLLLQFFPWQVHRFNDDGALRLHWWGLFVQNKQRNWFRFEYNVKIVQKQSKIFVWRSAKLLACQAVFLHSNLHPHLLWPTGFWARGPFGWRTIPDGDGKEWSRGPPSGSGGQWVTERLGQPHTNVLVFGLWFLSVDLNTHCGFFPLSTYLPENHLIEDKGFTVKQKQSTLPNWRLHFPTLSLKKKSHRWREQCDHPGKAEWAPGILICMHGSWWRWSKEQESVAE